MPKNPTLSLFPDPPTPDVPQLVLRDPDYNERRRVQAFLNSIFTKEQLTAVCRAFTTMLAEYPLLMKRLVNGNVVSAREDLDALWNYNRPKMDVADALAFFFADRENMTIYVSSLSPEMQELWKRILLRGALPFAEVREVLRDRDALSETHSFLGFNFSSTRVNRSELAFFDIIQAKSSRLTKYGTAYESANYLRLSHIGLRYFFYLFYPEASIGIRHVAGKAPEGMVVVSREAMATKAYPVILSLLAKGDVSLSSSFRASLKGLTRLRKSATMLEPFGISEPSDLVLETFGKTVTLLYQMETKGVVGKILNYPDLLHQLFSKNHHLLHNLLPVLFPHVKGLRAEIARTSLFTDFLQMGFDALRKSEGKWISPSDCFFHCLTHLSVNSEMISPALFFNPTLFEEPYSSYDFLLTSGETERKVTIDAYSAVFGQTFHKSLFFTLATLGLVELVCCPATQVPEQEKDSPFGRIFLARLTALGKYVFGLTETYEMSSDEQSVFHVEADSLIIRDLCTETPNPYLDLLKDIARPLGGGRYEVTAASFLKTCSGVEDLPSRINSFRKFICPKPSRRWEDFFNGLVAQSGLLRLDRSHYVVYSLDPSQPEFLRLISSDPELRRYALRAEGYRILVRSEYLTRFHSRLRDLGYLNH